MEMAEIFARLSSDCTVHLQLTLKIYFVIGNQCIHSLILSFFFFTDTENLGVVEEMYLSYLFVKCTFLFTCHMVEFNEIKHYIGSL